MCPAEPEKKPAALLSEALARVLALRAGLAAGAGATSRWLALKQWQSARLRRTYADLFAQPRYVRAGEFFLSELYGPKDFTQRDQEALRVVPKLARLLPERAIETLRLAVELDELSEILDVRLAGHLSDHVGIDDAGYCRAYRQAGTEAERLRQIDLVDQIGRSLEKLARVPLLTGLLHMMRRPAEAAGVAHLHQFLQSGFDAFKAMGPAGDFLATVRRRETMLMQRILAGNDAPFDGPLG
jgi:hypothetical protein